MLPKTCLLCASLSAAKKNKIKKLKLNFSKFLGSIFLLFGLWALELVMFDLKIGLSVKFPPRGLILRSQLWNLGPKKKLKGILFIKWSLFITNVHIVGWLSLISKVFRFGINNHYLSAGTHSGKGSPPV